MQITRRQAVKSFAGAIVALQAAILLEGCTSGQIAALVEELGTSSANLALLLGSSTLSAQIKALTATAVTDIQNWQAGSASQLAIEALTDLSEALGQIPILSADPIVAALVTLALGTITGLLALIPAPATLSTKSKTEQAKLPTIVDPPSDKAVFRARWNALVKSSSSPIIKKAHRGW